MPRYRDRCVVVTGEINGGLGRKRPRETTAGASRARGGFILMRGMEGAGSLEGTREALPCVTGWKPAPRGGVRARDVSF